MLGKLKRVELKEFEVKNGANKGRKFNKVIFTVDVYTGENSIIKQYKGSMGEEYARKYFNYVGIKTKDLIGKMVDVTLQKRVYTINGEEHTITEIKWLNVLDENGKPIYMTKTNNEVDF